MTEYYSAMKKKKNNELLIYAMTWRILRNGKLRDRGRCKRPYIVMIPFLGIGRSTDSETRLVVAWCPEERRMAS